MIYGSNTTVSEISEYMGPSCLFGGDSTLLLAVWKKVRSPGKVTAAVGKNAYGTWEFCQAIYVFQNTNFMVHELNTYTKIYLIDICVGFSGFEKSYKWTDIYNNKRKLKN